MRALKLGNVFYRVRSQRKIDDRFLHAYKQENGATARDNEVVNFHWL